MNETAWMGRYRPLVSALVYHGNNVSRTLSVRMPLRNGIALTQTEWQILEDLLEHERDDDCMSRIAERLGIPQSSLSKAVKALCGLGLVVRFRRGRNRKNVILRPTPLGRELYREQIPAILERCFGAFFETLKDFSDAELEAAVKAVRLLARGIEGSPEQEPLIPLDAADKE